MKIFDFSNGHRGEHLTSTGAIISTGPSYGITCGFPQPNKIHAPPIFVTSAQVELYESDTELDLTPSMLGVDAYCFCVGKFTMPVNTIWPWYCVGSISWALENAKTFTIGDSDRYQIGLEQTNQITFTPHPNEGPEDAYFNA